MFEVYLLTKDVVYQTQGVGPLTLSVFDVYLLTQDVVYQTQGVGPRAVSVQTGSLRSDSDTGQHDIHPDGDECRSLPGYLSSVTAYLQTEGDDWRRVAGGVRLRHAPTLHLQTGLSLVFVTVSDFYL